MTMFEKYNEMFNKYQTGKIKYEVWKEFCDICLDILMAEQWDTMKVIMEKISW